MSEKRKTCGSLNLVIILPKNLVVETGHPEAQTVGVGVMCSSPIPAVQGLILESCKYEF